MKLRDIDYFAQQRTSFFHNLPVKTKLILTAIIITFCLFNQNLFCIIGFYSVAIITICFSKLQKKELLTLSMYPLVFLAFYVFSLKTHDLEYILLVIFRVLSITTVFVTLLFSTPYTEIFKQFEKFLPKTATKIIFICYRSIFVLAEEMESLFLSLKLRGGFKKNKIKNIANVLGMLFINVFERSEKMYETLKVRGYLSKGI